MSSTEKLKSSTINWFLFRRTLLAVVFAKDRSGYSCHDGRKSNYLIHSATFSSQSFNRRAFRMPSPFVHVLTLIQNWRKDWFHWRPNFSPVYFTLQCNILSVAHQAEKIYLLRAEISGAIGSMIGFCILMSLYIMIVKITKISNTSTTTSINQKIIYVKQKEWIIFSFKINDI